MCRRGSRRHVCCYQTLKNLSCDAGAGLVVVAHTPSGWGRGPNHVTVECVDSHDYNTFQDRVTVKGQLLAVLAHYFLAEIDSL